MELVFSFFQDKIPFSEKLIVNDLFVSLQKGHCSTDVMSYLRENRWTFVKAAIVRQSECHSPFLNRNFNVFLGRWA